MKTKKKIFSIIFYTISAFIIPLPIIGYFYPQIYYPIAGWMLYADKNTSIKFKGYDVVLPKGWSFDDEINENSVMINKIPSSLFDYDFNDTSTFLNTDTRKKYNTKEMIEKFKKARVNKYNFKCVKTFLKTKKKTTPQIPIRVCKSIDKPFILSFYVFAHNHNLENLMNDLMKNIKIEKVK